eukprot:6457668-Amphidinium_carterae.1
MPTYVRWMPASSLHSHAKGLFLPGRGTMYTHTYGMPHQMPTPSILQEDLGHKSWKDFELSTCIVHRQPPTGKKNAGMRRLHVGLRVLQALSGM